MPESNHKEQELEKVRVFILPPLDLHQVIDKRLFAMHQLIAEKLYRDPESVLAKARQNLERWEQADGLSGAILEWREPGSGSSAPGARRSGGEWRETAAKQPVSGGSNGNRGGWGYQCYASARGMFLQKTR